MRFNRETLQARVQEAWATANRFPLRSSPVRQRRRGPGVEPEAQPKSWRIVGDRGLALAARLRLVWSIATDVGGRMAMTQAAFLAALPAVKGGPITVEMLRSAVELGRDDAVSATAVEGIVAWLQQNGRPEIGLDSFVQAKFPGPTAVDDFVQWITTGTRPLASNLSLLGRSRATPFHRSKDRRSTTRSALRFLLDPDPDFGATASDLPQMFQVVQGAGMPEGLRAFAQHLSRLARRGAAAGRPICYVPVGRTPDGNVKISRARLIGYLRDFCRGIDDLRTSEAPSGADDMKSALESIRTAMAKAPMIIILDGGSSPSGPLSALHSVIDDDGLLEVVQELLTPYRGPDACALDPLTFHRNRILILTEGEGLDFTGAPASQALSLPPPAHRSVSAIVKAQERPNPDAIVALSGLSSEFRTEAGISVLADLLARAPESADSLTATTFDQLVRAWSLAIRKDPVALVAMYALSITRDGMRVDTLRHILRRWRDAEGGRLAAARTAEDHPDADPTMARRGHWCLEDVDLDARLEAVLQALEANRLIVAGLDTPISGLDDLLSPQPQPNAMRDLRIATEALRSNLALVASQQEPADLVRRLHRIIAEEAIRQHSMISRHSVWSDSFDAIHYRRLLQGLFHGFASLGPTGDPHGKALEDSFDQINPRTLPAGPGNAYRRLYSVFYRGLMEMPPNWELSRVLGREDLKIELLLLAMNDESGLSQPWASVYEAGGELQPRRNPLLDAGLPRDRAIYLDQCLALGRAAFHRNDHALTAIALSATEACIRESWPGFDDVAPSPFPADRFAECVAWAKVASDEHNLVMPSTSPTFVTRQLTRAGFDATWTRRLSDIACLEESPSKPGQWPHEGLLTEFAAGVKPVRAPQLAAWADLLCRLGEALAVQTTTIHEAIGDRAADLRTAFVHLFAAERIRRLAFDDDPLSRDYYVNGHSTRTFVRVALDLVEALGTGTPQSSLPDLDFLVGQAERHLDMLSRFLARYPTEKSSLQVLRARFLRVTRREDGGDPLMLAEAMLHRADTQMSATRHRPRVRLRFLLERSRACLARLEADLSRSLDATSRRRLADAALLDAMTLSELAAGAEQQLWRTVAHRHLLAVRSRWTAEHAAD